MRLGVLLLLALGCGTSASASGAPTSDRGRFSAIVDRLGTPSASSSDIEALDAHRCLALPIVASALMGLPPVAPGKVGGALGRPASDLTERTIALLRALRALTSHDEYGPISRREYRALPFYREVPAGDGILKRDSLVARLPRGRSRYYSYWMSRGTYFFAPERTQRAIKAQWTKFVARFDCRAKLPEHPRGADFVAG